MAVQETFRNLKIKTKLIISFSLIIMMAAVVGVLVYSNLKKISVISHSLARPNERLERLNSILNNISEAESLQRTYSISREEKFLKSYFSEVYNINQDVDSLLKLSADEEHEKQVKKVTSLLGQKIKLLNELINLKSQDASSFFYEEAIDRVSQTSLDSSLVRKEIRTSVSGTENGKASELEAELEEADEEEKVRFFGRIRNFFSKKKDAPEPVKEPEIKSLPKIKTDTTIIYYAETDSIIGNVKRILSDVKSQAEEQKRLLMQRESQLLLEDKKIMDQIRTIIMDMEQHERESAGEYAGKSSKIVEQTTQMMFWFIMGAMLIIIVFTWLISMDVAKSNYIKKKLEDEKNKAQELMKARELFLANMSHEIRTPLGAIIGFSEQLEQSKALQTREKSFSQSIQKAARHLLQTVNEILDFSKIEAGKISIEQAPMLMKDIVTDVYQTLKINAEHKNIGFKYMLKGPSDIMLLGDSHRIKQVLLNLANNAIKFTEEGYVRLVCELSPQDESSCKVCLMVEDTGIGIPEEHQQHIFEEFTQADDSTTRKYGGTGLGLTISQKIVQMMGGSLSLQSKAGKGSTFTACFTLPQAQAQVAAESVQTRHYDPQLLAAKNILVVDDEELNRILIHTILEKWNVKTTLAENASSALKIIESNSFDLILTDIQMPQMSGYDLAIQIRNLENKTKASCPILAITANLLKQEEGKIKKSGINAHLLKPFEEKQLLEKIFSLLFPNIETDNHPDQLQADSEPGYSEVRTPSGTSDKETLYNLERLRQFTADNHDAMVMVLRTFIADTNNNLALLEAHKNEEDYLSLANLAHKMLNMFRMLDIQPAIGYLSTLESFRTEKADKDKAQQCIQHIKETAQKVVESLNRELAQYYTPQQEQESPNPD